MIWGSSFILMKKSLIKFNYMEVGFYRLMIAFIVLSPFLYSAIRKVKKHHIIPLLIVSLIGTVLPAIIFAKSQMHIQSSLACMLNSLTPFFTLIFGIIIFNKQLKFGNIIGIIIGLIGTYILLSPIKENLINTKYNLLIIFATMCYAISINTIKDKLHSLKALDIAVISSMLSAIVPFIYLFNSGVLYNVEKIHLNLSHFYYLIVLGGICTSLAIILFNYLIKRSSALFGSSTTYLIPVFAIIWGIIDSEFISNQELISIGIILTGVFIMNKKN